MKAGFLQCHTNQAFCIHRSGSDVSILENATLLSEKINTHNCDWDIWRVRENELNFFKFVPPTPVLCQESPV